MLTSSAAFADLETSSRAALGSVALHQNAGSVGLEDIIRAYGSDFLVDGSGIFAELPEGPLQVALGLQAQLALDRFAVQLASYERLSASGHDPLWAAVTGYYACFFAANALLLACGQGMVRVDSVSVPAARSGGLHSVRIAPGSTINHTKLELSPVGRDNHRKGWNLLVTMVDALGVTPGIGVGASQTLTSLSSLIEKPIWVSSARNDLNYDLSRSPFLAQFWPRELPGLSSGADIEDRLLKVMDPKPPQRFEIIMASCASLARELWKSFRSRGGKVDRHRESRRIDALRGYPYLEWYVDTQ